MSPKESAAKSKSANAGNVPGQVSATQQIDQHIRDLADWRGETLARLRGWIREVDAGIIEEVKWRGTPVWSCNGILCTGETYKKVVKLTFAKGASLDDPTQLFNSSQDGNTRRAIDIHEGEELDKAAFQVLVRAAMAANTVAKSAAKKSASSSSVAGKKTSRAKASEGSEVVLLSGGNPQIAKGYGDEPVQQYLAAMPGWKQAIGKRLDALISAAVPRVTKAVKWNTPFYGLEGEGWFVAFHCLTKYVKVSFFRGTSLKPLPPVESKQKEVRYFHVFEDQEIDEAQFVSWVKQAAALPGEKL